MAEKIHLFKEGSVITECCHISVLDARIQHGLGTYEPDAATCEGAPDDHQ